MPVLRGIEADFEREKPFDGMKVALSVHLEAKTAYLCRVLAAGGAQMYVDVYKRQSFLIMNDDFTVLARSFFTALLS